MTKRKQLGRSNAYTVEFDNGVKVLVSYNTMVAIYVPTHYKGEKQNHHYKSRLFLLPEYDHSNTTRQHLRKFYDGLGLTSFAHPSVIIGAEITTPRLRENRVIGLYNNARWDVPDIENGNYEIRF